MKEDFPFTDSNPVFKAKVEENLRQLKLHPRTDDIQVSDLDYCRHKAVYQMLAEDTHSARKL